MERRIIKITYSPNHLFTYNMEKTITHGTKITFTETNDKFELIKNPDNNTGFDVKPIKLSKNIPTEPYTFQELLNEYEKGKITIHGFEEADAPLVKSIFTNYIHTTEIEALKADITRITGEKEALEATNQELTTANNEIPQLKITNQELTISNEKLTTENSELKSTNKELTLANENLTKENEGLKITNEKLNAALEQETES